MPPRSKQIVTHYSIAKHIPGETLRVITEPFPKPISIETALVILNKWNSNMAFNHSQWIRNDKDCSFQFFYLEKP